MSEIENQETALQNFIAEIERIKKVFPSLFAVENVNELQTEERNMWEEYKSLFKKIEVDLSEFDINYKDALAGLLDEINKLSTAVGKVLSSANNPNRTEFLAWVNNRLGILSLNLQLLQNSKADSSTLQKSRERLLGEKKGLLL